MLPQGTFLKCNFERKFTLSLVKHSAPICPKYIIFELIVLKYILLYTVIRNNFSARFISDLYKSFSNLKPFNFNNLRTKRCIY